MYRVWQNETLLGKVELSSHRLMFTPESGRTIDDYWQKIIRDQALTIVIGLPLEDDVGSGIRQIYPDDDGFLTALEMDAERHGYRLEPI